MSLQALKNLLKQGRRALPQARFAPVSRIDTVTNPSSYSALADSATDLLGRSLPPQFRGAGFQNVPTDALGTLDDLRNIPFAGAARQRAQEQALKNFTRQAGSGTSRVPVIPTGGQRVPTVTTTGGFNPIVGNTPIVSKGANKSLIQQASQYMPKSPRGFLGRGFQIFEGANVINDLRKGNYGGAAMNAALMFPGRTLGLAKNALMNPYGATAASLLALELGAPASVVPGTMDSPEAKRAEELYTQLREDNRPDQGADLDMEAIRNLPGGSNNPLPPFNPNQDLPASAEQSVDTAPFQHQMAIYEQGRNAAQTQAERNQVRDLGLATHKAHNPQLYSNFQTPMASDRTFNPLMANMFPDTYPQTREAFIQERGVQMPQTMTNVDARNELIEGNRLEGERVAGELASNLEVQDFMKKFLSAQTGAQ